MARNNDEALQRAKPFVAAFAGAIVGQLILYLAIDLPVVLALAVAQQTNASLASGLIWLVMAAIVGAMLCALIGSGFGRALRIPRAFVIGLGLGALPQVLAAALSLSRDVLSAVFGITAYIAGGAALVAGYFYARRHNQEAGGVTSPAQHAHPAGRPRGVGFEERR